MEQADIMRVTYITLHGCEMAIGGSGRIVLEIDPEIKRRLYSMLALEQKTLKDWFIIVATEYIRSQQQPKLFNSSNTKQR